MVVKEYSYIEGQNTLVVVGVVVVGVVVVVVERKEELHKQAQVEVHTEEEHMLVVEEVA